MERKFSVSKGLKTYVVAFLVAGTYAHSFHFTLSRVVCGAFQSSLKNLLWSTRVEFQGRQASKAFSFDSYLILWMIGMNSVKLLGAVFIQAG
ncbi:unnamed protein product [Prunus armeniaca]|uniref:Uncharacterized protein n=1 Tax=Prunus armeniaca TaxID=36596 RepID=A0A6J5TXT6_PRUAR|nr:unnamed protein product [Prunus armeniaca]